MSTYDPWAHLAELPGLTLLLTDDDDLLEDAYAWYYPELHQIVMDKRLTAVEQRSALAHEIYHALRRHGPTGDPHRDQAQEDAADAWAASQLLDLSAARLLVQNGVDIERAADRLGVAWWLLEVALESLSEAS